MATSKFQKIYIRPETVPGDTVDSYADGLQVRTIGMVDPSAIKEDLIDVGVTRTDANDAGVSPVLGLASGELSLVTQISPATRDVSDVIASDNDGTYLSYVVGARDASANDECVADCTTTVIKATGHPYDADDIVMIGGEIRQVLSDDGADQFTLKMPLSSAPASGTKIYGCEWFDVLGTTVETVGVGVSQVDAEMQFNCRKCAVTSVEINPFEPAAVGQLTAKITIGGFDTAAITPASAVAGERGIVTGKAAGGFRFMNAAGALVSPSVSSVTAVLGGVREHILDAGAAEGKDGTIAGPTAATVEATMNQDSMYSVLAALKPSLTAAGARTEILMQVGSALEAAWAVYFPEAFLVEGPVAAEIGIVQGVKAKFGCARGYLIRA